MVARSQRSLAGDHSSFAFVLRSWVFATLKRACYMAASSYVKISRVGRRFRAFATETYTWGVNTSSITQRQVNPRGRDCDLSSSRTDARRRFQSVRLLGGTRVASVRAARRALVFIYCRVVAWGFGP